LQSCENRWANPCHRPVDETNGFEFLPRPFLYIAFKFVVFARTFASRLDVTGFRHSSRHAQAGQHPTHQHDVYCEKPQEPQPIKHKITSLLQPTIGDPLVCHGQTRLKPSIILQT